MLRAQTSPASLGVFSFWLTECPPLRLSALSKTQTSDAQAFPPMNMYGLAFTQKAAGLYGLKSSAQGSGRKRFIIVRSTNRTQLLESSGQKRLRDMLAAHEDSLDVLKPGTQAALAYRGKYQKLDSLHPSSVCCTQLDSCVPLIALDPDLEAQIVDNLVPDLAAFCVLKRPALY